MTEFWKKKTERHKRFNSKERPTLFFKGSLVALTCQLVANIMTFSVTVFVNYVFVFVNQMGNVLSLSCLSLVARVYLVSQ